MHINYISARLVQGQRWYIIFYQEDPLTGQRVRFRETYDLNRIKDLNARMEKAQIVIREINKKLPSGFPFASDHFSKLKRMNVMDALQVSADIKNNTDRERTRNTVNSILNIFGEFLVYNSMERLRIGELDKQIAIQFLDYAAIVRKVGNRTYNNYIERMRSICTELVDRQYLDENPFSGMKKRKESGKQRRAFNDYERQVVAEYIFKHDKWLTLAMLLQYHCFIRPIELRRLRFYMIDLDAGVIRLSKDITKNKENANVTIPDGIISYLRALNFEQWHSRWLIFGKRLEPAPDKSCSHNTMNYRHSQILKKLHKSKQLKDIKGLTFYSWKDTGALELFKKKVNILEIRKQLRHKDLKTTQLYCESLYEINKEIKSLENNLIDPKLLLMYD